MRGDNEKQWNIFRLLTRTIFILLLAMSELKSSAEGAAYCTKDDRCVEPFKNLARYDHYRIYNVELATEEHVELFKKLEEQSDSLTFIGHAREVGQKLSILVAAHKVADLADLLEHYQVKHRILVSGTFTFSHTYKIFDKFHFRPTTSKRKSIRIMLPSCLLARIFPNLIGITTSIWKQFMIGWNHWPRNILISLLFSI